MDQVKWPANAIDATGDDLGDPTKKFLDALGLSASANGEQVTLLRTPENLQLIKSGAQTLSKGWSSVAALVGGGAGISAFLKGVFTDPSKTTLQMTYLSAGVALVSVALIAIALIIRADIGGRATAAAAQFEARASATSAFLDGLREVVVTERQIVKPTYWVQTSTMGPKRNVIDLTTDPNDGLVVVTGDDRIPASDVKAVGTVD